MDKTLLKNDSKIHKQEGERGKKIGLHKNLKLLGNSLEIQWLGFHACTAEGSGLIPGWGTKIPQAGVAAPKPKPTFAWQSTTHKERQAAGDGKAPHTKKDKRQAMAKHHTQRQGQVLSFIGDKKIPTFHIKSFEN